MSRTRKRPRRVRPPGDYLFRLVDDHSGRKVVQVLSKDGRDIYGMFFVNRTDRRATPAQRAELALGEAPHGTPPSISAWWHPGDLEGRTFLYAPGEASWERPTSERSGD